MTAARRLRLRIAYDGRPFQGWQSQARGDTVQDRLEAALAQRGGGGPGPGPGAGGPGAGGPAPGQVAHADVPAAWRHDAERSRAALNAHLPPEIRVLDVRFVAAAFHARYSARGKIYRYRIWNDPVLTPFEIGRAWHLPGALDEARLREGARRIVGRRDFSPFAANRGQPEPDAVRTVRRIAVRRQGALWTLDFEGDGFLYKMVRLLTGSLVRCAQGRAPLSWLDGLLTGQGKTSFAAPAEGLYLMRVLYSTPCLR